MSMRITVSLLPQHPLPANLVPQDCVAVVVDVLRATSVMATALAHGAAQIRTFETVEQALQGAAEAVKQGAPTLLCGERNCQPIKGFDLGNSPAEYTRERVAGRTLVLTTTNGTRALAAANDFRQVVTASFLNLTATLANLQSSSAIHIICAGTNGAVTAEDTLLAGALTAAWIERCGATASNDEAVLAADFWQQRCGTKGLEVENAIKTALLHSQGGRNLKELDLDEDIRRCGQIDTLDVVPTVVGRDPICLRVV